MDVRSTVAEVRVSKGLRSRVRGIGGGASVVPLLLLFGLNAVDELDRTAFNLLLPEIQRYFGLNLTAVTALAAAVIPAALIFAIPVARLADRRRRVPIAVFGAATWGLFSTLTGLVPTVLLLGVARIGSGLGRAVNEPVHGSLLSDYYAPSARAKVFATHQAANTVGAFLGPSIAGWMAQFLEARYGLGVAWRLPFIVLAIPTFTLLVLAVIYLREPPRTGRSLVAAAEPPRLRQAFRLLWGVRTLRRIMLAFPFLSFVVIGFTPLTALFYKEIFLLTPGPRGTIQSFDAPFILLGLVVGAPLIDRGLRERPRTVMRRIGLMAAALSLPIAGFASAPELWMAIVFGYATVSVAILLLAGGRAIVSLVAPPEARASAFAVFGVFALLGVTALPLSGWIGDNYDLRAGIMMLTPALVLGGLVLASAASHVTDDIARVNAGYADDPSDGPR